MQRVNDKITLSLKRNAPWIHRLPLWPRIKVKWPRNGYIWSWEFKTGRKKPHSKISNGSPEILKTPKACRDLDFVKMLKSYCNWCKFGNFSKRCIFFGQECILLSFAVFFNSAVFQVMLKKRFHNKISNDWKSQPNFRDHVRVKLHNISYFMVFLSCLALKHFVIVRKWWGILEWVFLHLITRSIGEMMYEPSFTKLHSQKKEMQHFNSLKGCTSVTLHVLKLLSITRKPWRILEWGFLHNVTKSRGKMKLTTKLIYLHSSKKRNATFHGAFLLRLSVVCRFRFDFHKHCFDFNESDFIYLK